MARTWFKTNIFIGDNSFLVSSDMLGIPKNISMVGSVGVSAGGPWYAADLVGSQLIMSAVS